MRTSDFLQAGTRTGKAIGALVGENLAHYTAELGGKVCPSFQLHSLHIDCIQAPILVFDDADLISAVNGVAFASFIASGQTCVSGTRIIIQDGIYDQFMELFLAKVQSITKRIGDRKFLYMSSKTGIRNSTKQ